MPRSTVPDDTPRQREAVFVSTKEAARLLGLSRNHVYELLNQDAIESRYIGKRRLVMVSSLHDFIAALPTERDA